MGQPHLPEPNKHGIQKDYIEVKFKESQAAKDFKRQNMFLWRSPE